MRAFSTWKIVWWCVGVGLWALFPSQGMAQPVLEHQEVTEHHAPWDPGKRVVIRHSYGAVRLRAVEEGTTVSVRAHHQLAGMTRQAIQAYLHAFRINVQAFDDRVEVVTIRPPGEHKLLNQTTVDLDVVVPAEVLVDLSTRFGDLDVQGVGELKATAPFGAISVRSVAGNVTLEGKHGKVQIHDVRGDVRVTHSLGDVEVTRVEGSLVARNQFAQIRAHGIRGRAVVENRSGPITLVNLSGGAEVTCQHAQVAVSRVTGDLQVTNRDESVAVADVQGTVVVVNANGPVKARDINGDLKVDSRFGTVEVSQVRGKLTVEHSNGELSVRNVKGPAVLTNSHGLVQVDGVEGDCRIRNEFGAVTVRMVLGRLDVLNAWGLVQADLPPGGVRPAGSAKPAALAAPKNGETEATPEDAPAWYLETNHNNVILGVPSGTGCTLSVEANSGLIDAQFPLMKQRVGSKEAAHGDVQGGGMKVDVKVDLGMAQIQKRPAGSTGRQRK